KLNIGPPINCIKRLPAAWLIMDIAGIGEKPTLRSGPYFITVYNVDAAINFVTSSQSTRTKPPLPLACLYDFAFSSSSTMLCYASNVLSYVLSASRHKRINCLRTYGYLTRKGLYIYHEKLAPRGQPRGSNSGISGPVVG